MQKEKMIMKLFGCKKLTADAKPKILLAALLFSVFLFLPKFSQAATATGPLKINPTNPRYFTDGSGKAVYLTGSHTWSNFQNCGNSHPAINFTAYLDWLQTRNHNAIRLWVTDTVWNENSGSPCEPQPFVRTGPGNAYHGGLKFDLNKLNQTYFDELYWRVKAANDRGMYVMVMLFDVWGVSGYNNYGEWRGNPFYKDNNINGINGDPNGDGKGIEIHTLQIPAVTIIQEAYVRKVIDTLNELDNVLYEIINEGNDSTKDWQYHLITYIKNYEASKSKQHVVGINTLSMSYQYSSNAEFISPLGLGPTDSYAINPPVADGRKVVVVDTDHIEYPRDTDDPWIPAIWVWKSFTRGLNPIYMDRGGDFTGAVDKPGAENSRRAMGHTLTYANKMNLVSMLPSSNSSNCSTTYCLRNPGQEYLVYQPSSGAFTVNLVAGTYAYEWFNPATGTVASSGTVTVSAGNKSFTPPFSGYAVLYLINENLAVSGHILRLRCQVVLEPMSPLPFRTSQTNQWKNL